MLNAEMYKEVLNLLENNFAIVDGDKIAPCDTTPCTQCMFHGDCKAKTVDWLLSEYEEPKIESAVYDFKVDDKVEVSYNGEEWVKRHFKCIENDKVITWFGGRTSFSKHNNEDTMEWSYGRVPREENKS